MHYSKERRHGTLGTVQRTSPKGLTASERLAFIGWTINHDGCHEWRGAKTKDGYGCINFGGKTWLTHRLAYAMVHGSLDEEAIVRHRCDNPPCINPEHLEVGTIADNVRDAVIRRRTANGERQPLHKLSDADVAEIRRLAAAGMLSREIAQRFEIHHNYVTRLAAGRRRIAATNPPI